MDEFKNRQIDIFVSLNGRDGRAMVLFGGDRGQRPPAFFVQGEKGNAMQLTEQHEQLRDTVARFVENEINPFVDEWEAAEEFPAHALFKKLGALGVLGVKYDEAYGGLGLDFSYSAVVAEALGACNCGGVPMAIGVQSDMATPALHRFGGEELKRDWLAPTIAGDMVACLGVSEPGGGSDVAAIKTTARKDGGDYVISGSKMWITNGMQADWCCLLANTSEGKAHQNKSLIVVPMDAKGIDAPENPQNGHVLVRHRAAFLRRGARAADERHRRGGHGLHAANAAIPGGAAVGRGQFADHARPAHRRHHRLHAPAQGVRQVRARQSGRAFPPRGASHRGGGAALAHLARGRRAMSRART